MLALASLTGCAVEDSELSATQATLTSVEPEAPAIVDLPAGTVITNEQRMELKDVDGVGTYRMADDSYVIVRADEPLPEAVVQDAAADLGNKAVENEGRRIPPAGSDLALAKRLSTESGRNVYVVVRMIPDPYGIGVPSTPKWLIRPWDSAYYDSLEEAQAAAIAKAGGDASTVDFVVFDYVG